MKTTKDLERFKYIMFLLKRCELTLRERQFVEAVKNYFHENGRMTDQQESILKGIYKEKKWMTKAFFKGDPLKNSSIKAI